MKLRHSIPAALGAGLLLLAAPADAAAPGWTGSGVITGINPRDVGTDVIIPSLNSNPMGCATTSGAFRIYPNAVNYSAIVSILTTAYVTHKTVTLWINACDSGDGVPVFIAATVSG